MDEIPRHHEEIEPWRSCCEKRQNNSGLTQGPDGATPWQAGTKWGGGAHARHEAAQAHRDARRRGGRVAARGARAAAGAARGRLSRQQIVRWHGEPSRCIPQRPERGWTRRGRERHDRLSLGRGSTRSPARNGERAGPAGYRDRHDRRPSCGIRGQSGHHDSPHRFPGRRGPDAARSRHQHRPSQRQSHGDQYVGQRIGGQAVAAPAPARAPSSARCRPRKPEQCD